MLLQFYVGKNRGLIFRKVKCIFRQLLEGLDYLHKNDIIHRYIQNASEVVSRLIPRTQRCQDAEYPPYRERCTQIR